MKLEDKNKKSTALVKVEAEVTHLTPDERVVKQCERENGRVNPTWVEKGIARAERNAIKARPPVQLFKTALQRAIAAGEAKQSAVVEAQKELSVAWCERDKSLGHLDKPTFYRASQVEYGESEYWDSDTWRQVITDLKEIADWVKAIGKGPF